MSTSMADYYQARAPEFEIVYDKPERQADLPRLRSWLADEARGATLLEVACGTGYWTSVAATTAKAIVATDFNPGPLEIARSKGLGPHVTFAQADALRAAGLWPRVRCRDGAFLVVARVGRGPAEVSRAFRLQAAARGEAPHDRQHLRRWLDGADIAHGCSRQHLSDAPAAERPSLTTSTGCLQQSHVICSVMPAPSSVAEKTWAATSVR